MQSADRHGTAAGADTGHLIRFPDTGRPLKTEKDLSVISGKRTQLRLHLSGTGIVPDQNHQRGIYLRKNRKKTLLLLPLHDRNDKIIRFGFLCRINYPGMIQRVFPGKLMTDHQPFRFQCFLPFSPGSDRNIIPGLT